MARRPQSLGGTPQHHGVRATACAALLVMVACAGNARAAAPATPDALPTPAAVRVERLRPRRETLPTLRFLRTNRDFFRSRLDQLREQPLAQHGPARGIDPRFLAYREMVNAALSAADSVGAAASAREHLQILAGVSDFSRLEGELDQMDRLLAAQRSRLGVLQADFAGRQRTALAIVVGGCPEGTTLDSVSVRFDDGSSRSMAISPDEREALAHGGVLELFHGLIEPREQLLEISLAGAAFTTSAPAFVTLVPSRDRLTFLRLDVAPVRAATGAAAVLASTWVHDDALTAAGEGPARP